MIEEQELWIAVIHQAFYDASKPTHRIDPYGNTKESNDYSYILSARDFLTSKTRGFEDICNVAGLDPDWVMDKYRQLLTSNFNQREKERVNNGNVYTYKSYRKGTA